MNRLRKPIPQDYIDMVVNIAAYTLTIFVVASFIVEATS